MAEQEKIPEYLFVTKIHESRVRGYKLISALSNGKYLYEDIENGFKECFLYTDIFSTLKSQGGYGSSLYKDENRNEKIRRKRRKGVCYERKYK